MDSIKEIAKNEKVASFKVPKDLIIEVRKFNTHTQEAASREEELQQAEKVLLTCGVILFLCFIRSLFDQPCALTHLGGKRG